MRISVVSDNKKLRELIATLDQDIYHFSYFYDLSQAALSLMSSTEVLIVDDTSDINSLAELKTSLDGVLPYLIYIGEQLEPDLMLQFYSLGVDEYFPLAHAAILLDKKLFTYNKTQNRLTQLSIDYEFAHKTAMDAMAGSSELGLVMNFVEQSYTINDCKALSHRFFLTTNALGLNCVLRMQMNGQHYFFSSNELVKPLEEQLMIAANNAQRFHDFGVRTVINYPNASLLVKNMPVEDGNRYGRIKDALPVLLSALDAKLKSLVAENMIRSQAEDLGGAFDVVKASFDHLNGLMSEKIKSGNQTMSNVLSDLTHKLPGMGLEEDQEEYILGKVENVMDDSSELIMAEQEMAQIFDSIRDSLYGLVAKQNLMLSVLMKEKMAEEENQQQSLTEDSNIELF
ncbi:MAG: hypothetical protein OEX12_03810 [Gammaproteobacteria bacterium]|nr:hypothetical protein [Gammaproteobacteria bacterium]